MRLWRSRNPKTSKLFANSDIGNMTKKPEVGEPPRDYMETVYGETPPVQTERTRAFNFREFCQNKDEEDPSMEEEGNEWNEMRAVLNDDNMVGLLYIYDPDNDPQQHRDLAKKCTATLAMNMRWWCSNCGSRGTIRVICWL
eukprot:GHUV01040241.1.p1 GENE.GHUV01040241.1~~GHUV01040241.1.p1  ORF type:complete len:141 (+),score=26.68 GHUV01040241.1:192-614(+)